MAGKLIHVSLVVQESHLWGLLHALEHEHKVGNVEVHAVATPFTDEPVEPAENPYKGLRRQIYELFQDGKRWQIRELEQHLQAKHAAVGSAVSAMLRHKHIKRVAFGVYAKR